MSRVWIRTLTITWLNTITDHEDGRFFSFRVKTEHDEKQWHLMYIGKTSSLCLILARPVRRTTISYVIRIKFLHQSFEHLSNSQGSWGNLCQLTFYSFIYWTREGAWMIQGFIASILLWMIHVCSLLRVDGFFLYNSTFIEWITSCRLLDCKR